MLTPYRLSMVQDGYFPPLQHRPVVTTLERALSAELSRTIRDRVGGVTPREEHDGYDEGRETFLAAWQRQRQNLQVSPGSQRESPRSSMASRSPAPRHSPLRMELEGIGRIDESVATAAAIEGASPRRKFRLMVDRRGVPVIHD
jgi:hypothetical protein